MLEPQVTSDISIVALLTTNVNVSEIEPAANVSVYEPAGTTPFVIVVGTVDVNVNKFASAAVKVFVVSQDEAIRDVFSEVANGDK